MNTRRPLSSAEHDIIISKHARGASLRVIRLELYAHGFVRGENTIGDFLASRSLRPNGSLPRTESVDHTCTFCSWRGPHEHYYAHWRQHHRTLAGFSRQEIAQHA